MTKTNKAKQQARRVIITCISLFLAGAVVLIIRFYVSSHGCPSCFTSSLANRILLYAMMLLIIGNLISLPVMIYKIRRSKKDTTKEDEC